MAYNKFIELFSELINQTMDHDEVSNLFAEISDTVSVNNLLAKLDDDVLFEAIQDRFKSRFEISQYTAAQKLIDSCMHELSADTVQDLVAIIFGNHMSDLIEFTDGSMESTERLVSHLLSGNSLAKEVFLSRFCDRADESDLKDLVNSLAPVKRSSLLEFLGEEKDTKKLELVRFGEFDYTLFYGGVFLLKLDSLSSVKDVSNRLTTVTVPASGILSFQQAYNEHIKGKGDGGTE